MMKISPTFKTFFLFLLVLAGGMAWAAPAAPQVWKVPLPALSLVPPRVDLIFYRVPSGLPEDVAAYWRTRDALQKTSVYRRDIGEGIYRDFARQRFIADGSLYGQAFNNGRLRDVAVDYRFGIFLRNNTTKPVLFELGGFGSDDPGIQNWHYALWWYGGVDLSQPFGQRKILKLVADDKEIRIEPQLDRLLFPSEPVQPGEFMALEFEVANRASLGGNDRYILERLQRQIQVPQTLDLRTLTSQLHNTIVVYPVSRAERGEKFLRLRVDMFLDTRPDHEPRFHSPLLSRFGGGYADIGEVGVKLHFSDSNFWDRVLRKLGSSYKEFTSFEPPAFPLPQGAEADADPVSSFQDLVTDPLPTLGSEAVASSGRNWLERLIGYLKSLLTRFRSQRRSENSSPAPTSPVRFHVASRTFTYSGSLPSADKALTTNDYQQFLEIASQVFSERTGRKPVSLKWDLQRLSAFQHGVIILVIDYPLEPRMLFLPDLMVKEAGHLPPAARSPALFWRSWEIILERLGTKRRENILVSYADSLPFPLTAAWIQEQLQEPFLVLEYPAGLGI